MVMFTSDYATFQHLHSSKLIDPSAVIEYRPTSQAFFTSMQTVAEQALQQFSRFDHKHIQLELESLLGRDQSVVSVLGNYIHDPYFNKCNAC